MNQINIGDRGNNQDLFTDLFSHEVAERISAGDGTGIEMNATNANTDGEYQNAQISDNEPDDGNYMYRLNGANGQLVQAYWSIKDNGFVVPDGNSQKVYLYPTWKSSPSLYFTGESELDINGDQHGYGSNDNAIISTASNGALSVNLNGQTVTFNPGQISTLYVSTGGGANNISVLSTPKTATSRSPASAT